MSETLELVNECLRGAAIFAFGLPPLVVLILKLSGAKPKRAGERHAARRSTRKVTTSRPAPKLHSNPVAGEPG